MLIFFILTGSYPLFGVFTDPLTAVVGGLTLYNGSVIAEIIRAGINAVPKGQSEAAQAIGLRPGEVMRTVLLPQAITAMMPAIVSQLIILLKDSALGFIVAYPELVSQAKIGGNFFGNVIPTMIVVAIIYIIVNWLLGRFANWLERRNARRGRGSAAVPTAPGVDLETPTQAPA
jgi:glutamate transport system permease protein